jgi:hypothetical protein
MKRIYILIVFIFPLLSKAQSYTEVLGRPTDSTITMSILFDKNIQVYWEYGTTPGSYTITSPIYSALADSVIEAPDIIIERDTD